MSHLPSKIKIGPYKYKIGNRPNDNTWGTTVYKDHMIHLDDNTPEDRKPVVILHEVIHACFELAGIDTEHEEKIITALSPALYQVMMDNPKLKEYLWQRR